MLKFIIRRIIYIAFVLFLASGFIFFLYRSMPGDPALQFMEGREQELDPAAWQLMYDEIVRTMGLDQPIVVQYFYWIGQLMRGNLGYSMETRETVQDFVRAPMLNTITLNIINLVLVFAITIPAGIYCAIRRGKIFDNGMLVFTTFGLSTPSFLLGIILLVIFGVFWGILPLFGMHSANQPDAWTMEWVIDRLRHMALPLATLTLTSLAGLVRYIRTAMLDALNQDYIRTARAKGLAEKTVIYVHAFRNALIPTITVMAGWFGGIFGGSVIVERLFAWHGMGHLLVNAIDNRDYGVGMVITLFMSFVVFVTILLMEIMYVIVDPRIRFE